MRTRVCKDDQIRLITECRNSGLSDYQWCTTKGIHPGNFYNWVSKLRKNVYIFPESKAKQLAEPNLQDVVKLELVDQSELPVYPKVEQCENQSMVFMPL